MTSQEPTNHSFTNTDPDTGIRYGVISQHSVGQAWGEESEGYYGEPTCPECGGGTSPFDNEGDEYEQLNKHGCADYVCHHCKLTLDSGDVFSDEAISWSVDKDGYKLEDCLTSDIMVIRSPFYTFAKLCSPCVPGAGNLGNVDESGFKTYCLGHDWFDEGEAPYPVYSVESGNRIEPEKRESK